MAVYLDDKYLRKLLDEYAKTGKVSDELVNAFYLMAKRLSSRYNLSGYTWKEDMIQTAVIRCVNNLHNYSPDKGEKAFNYFTTIIYREFIAYINKEKRYLNMLEKKKEELEEQIRLEKETHYEDL